MAEAFDGSQNLVCGLGPFEGLRVSVVHVDEGADVGFELPDGSVNTSPDLLSGEFSKPALDLIDPRRGSRRKMDMIVRPAGEPRFDLGCLVGGVVVHDDMNIEPFRDLIIDLFEEFQELDCPVALVAFADDKPRGDIECGKQRGRTMPHIAVRTTLRHARHHRQDRLLAIERLNLAFLIDAEDERTVRWG